MMIYNVDQLITLMLIWWSYFITIILLLNDNNNLFMIATTAQQQQCIYNHPHRPDPNKIRLCVSSRHVNWINKTVKGMIHEKTTIFCSPKSVVTNYFTLINLTIPSSGNIIDISMIEDSCDLLISVSSGRFTYDSYHKLKDLPLVAAIPTYIDILLIWSDKMRWKQWMIDNGFGHYVSNSIDLNNATYPFVMKEGLSENSQGVSIIENSIALQEKLIYFKENKITNYYGEEALTGMGRAQGIFYISAFEGKVLNIQCYLMLGHREDIVEQNFPQSIFIAGKPKDMPFIRGYPERIDYSTLNISSVLADITLKGKYTGIYCAEFKMNTKKEVIFMEFNARICYRLTQDSHHFNEAYLPLARAVQRHIRSLKVNHRSSKIIEKSYHWYHNNEFQLAELKYQSTSRMAMKSLKKLRKFSSFNLSL